ncbi:unnamed protein product [Ilex paraguariensis]|uniref:Uncharacterized protein n=1 Tax=Ilex paraguariensis TaxID=185542 RepID=A0ABC8SXP2_9AQUA
MDAIHSLQLILRGSLQDEIVDDSKMIMNVPFVDTSIERVDELRIVSNEMVRLIETASVPQKIWKLLLGYLNSRKSMWEETYSNRSY